MLLRVPRPEPGGARGVLLGLLESALEMPSCNSLAIIELDSFVISATSKESC